MKIRLRPLPNPKGSNIITKFVTNGVDIQLIHFTYYYNYTNSKIGVTTIPNDVMNYIGKYLKEVLENDTGYLIECSRDVVLDKYNLPKSYFIDKNNEFINTLDEKEGFVESFDINLIQHFDFYYGYHDYIIEYNINNLTDIKRIESDFKFSEMSVNKFRELYNNIEMSIESYIYKHSMNNKSVEFDDINKYKEIHRNEIINKIINE